MKLLTTRSVDSTEKLVHDIEIDNAVVFLKVFYQCFEQQCNLVSFDCVSGASSLLFT